MFQTYDLSIALVDFIPSILFLIAIILIFLHITLNSIDEKVKYGWLGGGLIAASGGFFKSTWKLIIAVSGHDLELLDNSLFVLQSIGFTLMLIFLLIFIKKGEISLEEKVAPLLFIATWKLPFLITMIIANITVLILLIYIAKKRQEIKAIICFVITLLMIFIMAGMSQTALTITDQWISEIINSITQAFFAVGAFLIYKTN